MNALGPQTHLIVKILGRCKYYVFNVNVDIGSCALVSVPEMRIWSILKIKNNIKWCIHLSRSLFLCFNYLVSVTAGGQESPRGHSVDFG